MKFKKSTVDKTQWLGFEKVAGQTGSNNRSVRKALIRKYKRYFTDAELRELKTKSVDEINAAIDLKVGKFK